MSNLHLMQIARKLHELFESSIPQDDIAAHDPEREQKLLTRCLAAFGIYSQSGCEAAHAAASVTDGGDDNGVDAVYFSLPNKTLYIVQSKWIKDGNG